MWVSSQGDLGSVVEAANQHKVVFFKEYSFHGDSIGKRHVTRKNALYK